MESAPQGLSYGSDTSLTDAQTRFTIIHVAKYMTCLCRLSYMIIHYSIQGMSCRMDSANFVSIIHF